MAERKNIGSIDNQGDQGNVAGEVHGDQVRNKTVYVNQPSPPPKPKRDKTQQELLDWVDSEVESRLLQSLHNRIYILLDKKEDPSQVNHPSSIVIKIGSRQPFQLPSGTSIIDIYDRKDINSRLLILGAPGSGKTTTLLELAKELVKRAQGDTEEPIPVLLNLSSWKDDKQSIANWMIDNLKLVYGLRKDIGQQFLSQGALLPLLDGLDELAPSRQSLCVEKLNDFLEAEGALHPLVVSSRTKEYQFYKENLALNGSIIIQLLNREQIQDFILRTEGKGFWDYIENDEQILDIAKAPLFLNILVISYSEISFHKWQQLESSEQRISYLFEAYITKMFARQNNKPSKNQDKANKWLGWLGSRLIQENETEFFIEHLQPFWLNTKKKRLIYGLIGGLIGGLIVGLIGGLIVGLIGGLILGLIGGLIGGLILGLILGLTGETIKPIESLSFSLINFRNNLIYGLIYGLILGLIYGLILGLILGLIYGLILGLIYGLILGLILGLTGPEIKQRKYSNQGIKQSVKNGIRLSVIAISFSIIISVLIQSIIFQIIIVSNLDFNLELLDRLNLTVLGVILILSIWFSALPVIQHVSLRLVLWLFGHAPWNYAKFLDYATDRMILQRVGGGYRFIHRLLQEHFAKTYGDWDGEETKL